FSGEEIETLIPKRKLIERRQGVWHERILKLFPGYIFIKTKMDNFEIYYKLKELPTIISVLKDGCYPMTVPENEMEIILALTRYGDVIDFSELYKEGDKIKVKNGPLQGLEGIIDRYDH